MEEMRVTFVTTEDVRRLLEELPSDEKEKLLAEAIAELPVESKTKLLGLTGTGLTVVSGSFVSLNSQVALNIQGSNGIDPEALMKAIVDFRKAQG
jgi:23S rRNA A2030 N6-methylase RlmJ